MFLFFILFWITIGKTTKNHEKIAENRPVFGAKRKRCAKKLWDFAKPLAKIGGIRYNKSRKKRII